MKKIVIVLYDFMRREAKTVEVRHGDREATLGLNAVHVDDLCDDLTCSFCRELAVRIMSRTNCRRLEKRVYGV